MLDFIACEPQFVDHAAPVWVALPPGLRGRFLTDAALVERATGIDAEAVDAEALRRASRPPAANPGPGPMAFVTSIGDTKVARRLGYRRFVFMEHGAGQAYMGDQHGARHPSYAGGLDREDVDLFLVPNEYSAALWRRSYPAAGVEVIGCPKLDTLPAREPEGMTTVAISFHWPAFVAPEAGTALGHYRDALGAFAQRFHVIGHAHPKGDWPERMARVYRRAGIEFVRDFDEVCRRADVYLCDNSSTLFEFAATGRPVGVLNCPQYRRNVHHGGRFWDWADIGIQIDGPAALLPAVEDALRDREAQQERREAVLRLVYAYRTGAAERAAEAIASRYAFEAVA